MLKLFEIKGQGKAQYGNFQTPQTKRTPTGGNKT